MKIAIYSDDFRATEVLPFEVDGKPQEFTSLEGFIKYLRTALLILTDSDAPDAKPIVLEPAFPDYIINKDATDFRPVITWAVSMNPASLGGKAHKNPEIGVRETKKRVRYQTEVNGDQYEVSGQQLDCWFRFDVWATEVDEVEALAQWFRSYFMEVFGEKSGASICRFWTRDNDKEVAKINDALHVRSLTYHVQFEERSAVRLDRIQAVTAEIEQVYLSS